MTFLYFHNLLRLRTTSYLPPTAITSRLPQAWTVQRPVFHPATVEAMAGQLTDMLEQPFFVYRAPAARRDVETHTETVETLYVAMHRVAADNIMGRDSSSHGMSWFLHLLAHGSP